MELSPHPPLNLSLETLGEDSFIHAKGEQCILTKIYAYSFYILLIIDILCFLLSFSVSFILVILV